MFPMQHTHPQLQNAIAQSLIHNVCQPNDLTLLGPNDLALEVHFSLTHTHPPRMCAHSSCSHSQTIQLQTSQQQIQINRRFLGLSAHKVKRSDMQHSHACNTRHHVFIFNDQSHRHGSSRPCSCSAMKWNKSVFIRLTILDFLRTQFDLKHLLIAACRLFVTEMTWTWITLSDVSVLE